MAMTAQENNFYSSAFEDLLRQAWGGVLAAWGTEGAVGRAS